MSTGIMRRGLWLGLALGLCHQGWGFMGPPHTPPSRLSSPSTIMASTARPALVTDEKIRKRLQSEWELDCYSRPVMVEGKKLWELLITDGLGEFKRVETIPSNMVNSRELRKLVEQVMDEAEEPPTTIRFFRKSMQNMITLALKELEVRVLPSRATNALYGWLEEREREVYPKMEGYNARMKETIFNDLDNMKEPGRMPEELVTERFGFMCLPASVFLDGEINEENIGVGRLIPLDPSTPRDTMVQGIVMYGERSATIARRFSSVELCYIKANFNRRQLVLEMDIDSQYLLATLNDVRKTEAQLFEKGKEKLGGIHFLALQESAESEGVDGFFMLKERMSSL